jgi:hypothetical protein
MEEDEEEEQEDEEKRRDDTTYVFETSLERCEPTGEDRKVKAHHLIIERRCVEEEESSRKRTEQIANLCNELRRENVALIGLRSHARSLQCRTRLYMARVFGTYLREHNVVPALSRSVGISRNFIAGLR